MLNYVLIIIAFSLLGVAGLQFFYLSYIQRLLKEYKHRIAELEKEVEMAHRRIYQTELQLDQHQAIIESNYSEYEEDVREEETWAEIIEAD